MVVSYKQYIKNKFSTGIILALILLIAIILSINTGNVKFGIFKLFSVFFRFEDDPTLLHILLNIRLPRVVNALLAGAALSVSGAIMQNLLKNPLASPFTLGISHGAVFGAAVAITLNKGVFLSYSIYTVVFFAFIGALLTMLIILLIGAIKGFSAYVVILAGVGLSSLFASLTMLLQYFSSDEEVAAIVFWTFGDLNKTTWNEIYIILLITIPALIYFILKSPQYNITIWDDATAESLGINVKMLKITGLLLTCLITAAIVSFMGIIGFIGLISPHIIRLIIGNDHRFLLPYSIILGSTILLFSDIIGRIILTPATIPVGIITSLLGVPVFFYILLKNKGTI